MGPKTDSTVLVQVAERAMLAKGFVPHPPAEAMAEAERVSPAGAEAGLRDLRSLPWTSIDNIESQDLDQIEVAEEVAGGVRLMVGIADVSHFVPPGSAIDIYAANNTVSVYSGVRTFPMLPERLSFHLSSLLAHEVRPAIVIETIVGDDGAIGEAKTYLALVENHAKLDYPSVSAWLDGGPRPAVLDDPALEAQVRLHDRLSKTLGAARKKAGAIDVDTAEVRAVVDAHGQVTRLEQHVQDRAGKIIEELMVASNRAVAHILDQAGLPSIRRVVKRPERWARIVSYAAEHGATLPAVASSLSLAQFVDEMRRTRPEQFGEISLALVKLMGRGEYVAHAPHAPDIGHFGLATAEYTHATAPNRRYPDLVTQRSLRALALGQAAPYTFDELNTIAQRCSKMEAEAEKVQRAVQKSAAAQLLAPSVGHTFDGVVTGAGDKGVFVRLLSPCAEGKIVKHQEGLAVGQSVRVRLLDVSVEKGFIDFDAIR